MIFSNTFKNAWVLSISSALAGSAGTMMMLLGGLIGTDMAPSKIWATAPNALMIIGSAASVIPVNLGMRKLGRKHALWLFMALGMLTCWLATVALGANSFLLFCAASLLFGTLTTALMQSRFAAMESVASDARASAASLVMGGGIIAAFMGPEMAVLGANLTAVTYQGSFWLSLAIIGLAAALLALYTPVQSIHSENQGVSTKTRELLRSRSFCTAVIGGIVAYAAMSFIMTGTPISMHHIHGHSLIDTKWVIQSHIAAMFLPSFIAPLLFKRLGIRGMMLMGLGCFVATIVGGSLDTSVPGFWLQLVLLGVGWNFLFIASTTLLPLTHMPKDNLKAQAVNDFGVFAGAAISAFAAGWAINLLSWQQITLLCSAPVALMLAVLLWERMALNPTAGAQGPE